MCFVAIHIGSCFVIDLGFGLVIVFGSYLWLFV